MGETDATGDLLLNTLDCLRPACLSEETMVILRSGNLRSEFVVRWAPQLWELGVEDEEIILRFNGPEDTSVRLWLRGPSGEAFWTRGVPCLGKETTARIPLSIRCPSLGYLSAEYILSNGEARPAAWQMQVTSIGTVEPLLTSWLEEGIGIAEEQDMWTVLMQMQTALETR
jgi:hypothetical protein